MPPSEAEIKIARLEQQAVGHDQNIQRNEGNIGKLYDKVDETQKQVTGLHGKVDRLTGKFDIFCDEVRKTSSAMATHIKEEDEKELEAVREKAVLSTKQKIMYGIAVAILGAMASGIMAIIVHFVKGNA